MRCILHIQVKAHENWIERLQEHQEQNLKKVEKCKTEITLRGIYRSKTQHQSIAGCLLNLMQSKASSHMHQNAL